MENHLENDTGSAGSGIRQNPFSELLSISLKDELNEKLQKSFGGYSKKSVGQYVSSMRSNLQRIQQQMERQINDLLAEKASVSQECTVLREQLKETEASLQKVQDQIVNQKYYEESREASEQELQKFRAENQRLSEMLADYEQTCEQKKRVEALLVEKENEIVRLNESLSRYQKECEELRSRTARLEQAAETASRNPDKTELSNLRREKEMADEQCRKLAQQLKESRRVLLEKSRGLEASRAALEKERESISLRQQQADDTQETKYRQMAQRLKEGQDALEKKKEELEAARNAFQQEKEAFSLRQQQADDAQETKHRQVAQQLEEARSVLEKKKELEAACAAFRQEKEAFSLRQQDNDARETKHRQMVQQLKEAKSILEKKGQELEASRTALRQEKEAFSLLQQQADAREAELKNGRAQLDQEHQELEGQYAQLAEDRNKNEAAWKELKEEISKNRIVAGQLEKEHQAIKQENESLRACLAEKEKQLTEMKNKLEGQSETARVLSEKINSFYEHFSQDAERIKSLEKMNSEKEMLVKHYQQAEKKAVLSHHENERARQANAALRETVQQLMQQMEIQSESVELFLQRSMKERSSMKQAVSDQAALKLKNITLMEQVNSLLAQMDQLRTENERLKAGEEQRKTRSFPFPAEKKVTPLEKTEAADDAEEEDKASELEKCGRAYRRAKELVQELEQQTENIG